MNLDQRKWFSKNIIKTYKQNGDLQKVLTHPEFKNEVFLYETIMGLINSVMGKKYDTPSVMQLLNQISALPIEQRLVANRAAFNLIGTKYWRHTNLVEHSFNQICTVGQSNDLFYVFDTWAQVYTQQLLIPLYIQKTPEQWRVELESSVVRKLAQDRYPHDLFRFIPHIQWCPIPEVVNMYLSEFCRSPDHSMQEVERIIDHSCSPQMLDFTKVLLNHFANHQNFAQWHNIPKSRHERMTVKVQNIILSRQVGIENGSSENARARSTRKI